MPKNLKDFAQMKFESEEKNAQKMQQEVPDDLQNFYDAHRNLSQSELQNELLMEVAKQKAAGTFDFEKLSKTFEMVSPFLSDDQKNHINSMLQGLK